MIFRKGMIYEMHVWREAQDTYSELAQTYMYTLTHTCPVKAWTSGVTTGDTQRQHRRSHHDSVSAATWFQAARLRQSPYRTCPHVTSVDCVSVSVCVWLLMHRSLYEASLPSLRDCYILLFQHKKKHAPVPPFFLTDQGEQEEVFSAWMSNKA